MHIAITFRHLDSSPAIKDYAYDKVGKLQRFLRKPATATVTLSVEKGEQMAEVQLNAGSEHYTAKETTAKMYSSIERVCEKIGHQMQNAKGIKMSAKRSGMRAGEFARTSQLELAAAAEEED